MIIYKSTQELDLFWLLIASDVCFFALGLSFLFCGLGLSFLFCGFNTALFERLEVTDMGRFGSWSLFFSFFLSLADNDLLCFFFSFFSSSEEDDEDEEDFDDSEEVSSVLKLKTKNYLTNERNLFLCINKYHIALLRVQFFSSIPIDLILRNKH